MPTSKLIAVDCDGTLFDKTGYPSPQTCHAVQRLVDAGHQIVAATGRSRLSAVNRLLDVPGMRYLICSNGAYVWDAVENHVAYESEMPQTLVKQIVSTLRESFTDVAFNWESKTGFNTEDSFTELAGGVDELETGGQAGELGSEALYKLKVRRPGIAVAQLQVEQAAVLGSSLCEITTSGAPFTELSSLGANKASGLETLSTMLGFTAADVIVFGDHHNDLPMFKWAGHAVAMGNAMDDVKAVANATTLANTADGVADYLLQLFNANRL